MRIVNEKREWSRFEAVIDVDVEADGAVLMTGAVSRIL
jgi:hypothetical protein